MCADSVGFSAGSGSSTSASASKAGDQFQAAASKQKQVPDSGVDNTPAKPPTPPKKEEPVEAGLKPGEKKPAETKRPEEKKPAKPDPNNNPGNPNASGWSQSNSGNSGGQDKEGDEKKQKKDSGGDNGAVQGPQEANAWDVGWAGYTSTLNSQSITGTTTPKGPPVVDPLLGSVVTGANGGGRGTATAPVLSVTNAGTGQETQLQVLDVIPVSESETQRETIVVLQRTVTQPLTATPPISASGVINPTLGADVTAGPLAQPGAQTVEILFITVVEELPKSSLTGAATTYNSVRRFDYKHAIEEASSQAFFKIETAEASNYLPGAREAAEAASVARNATRTEFQNLVTPGNRVFSRIFEGTGGPRDLSTLYNKYLAKAREANPNASEFRVYEVLAAASGRSNKFVINVARVMRVAGPVMTIAGVVGSGYRIANASAEDRSCVAAQEVGGTAGGLLGAELGIAGGSAAGAWVVGAAGIASGPAGWIVLGAGAIGSVVVGWGGNWAGEQVGGAIACDPGQAGYEPIFAEPQDENLWSDQTEAGDGRGW